jgi:hypothetical protein
LQDCFSNIEESRDCIGTVNALYNFITASPKRLALFQNAQLSATTKSVKALSTTRWASRKNSFESVANTLPFIYDTLEYIKATGDKASKDVASPLLNSIRRFEFIFMVKLLHDAFTRTGLLSTALQDPQLDMDRLDRLKRSTIDSLKIIRSESKFTALYNDSMEFSKDEDVEMPSLPRQANRPNRYKDALPSVQKFNTIEEKYKSIYFRILDSCIEEIEKRFADDTLGPLRAMSHILKQDAVEENSKNLEIIRDLNFYNNMINFDELDIELKSYHLTLKMLESSFENIDHLDEIANVFVEHVKYFFKFSNFSFSFFILYFRF